MNFSLSIIIPVYNVEKYLEKCVASVLKQVNSSCEIILVDDGSTDSSGLLCDSLAEKNTELDICVIHQKNKGLGGARNTGIEHAKKEFLFFIDSDDIILDGAIPKLEKYVLEHPDADIVTFDIEKKDPQGKLIYSIKGCEQDFTYASIFENHRLLLTDHSACNKIIRKSLFLDHNIRFPERIWYEDLATIINLYPYAKKIGYVSEPFYQYLDREGSIINSSQCDKNIDMITACDSLFSFYKKNNLFQQFHEELEYIIIFHLYYTLSVRILQIDRHHKLLDTMRSYIYKEFPEFMSNKYMSKKEKIIVSLLNQKKYKTILMIFKVKGFLNQFIKK